MESQGKPGRGIVKRLARFFSQKAKSPQEELSPQKVSAVYYGDVLDDSGSIMCEGGPIPLDEKTSQMVSKYRMEAKAAQSLQTSPAFTEDIQSYDRGLPDGLKITNAAQSLHACPLAAEEFQRCDESAPEEQQYTSVAQNLHTAPVLIEELHSYDGSQADELKSRNAAQSLHLRSLPAKEFQSCDKNAPEGQQYTTIAHSLHTAPLANEGIQNGDEGNASVSHIREAAIPSAPNNPQIQYEEGSPAGDRPITDIASELSVLPEESTKAPYYSPLTTVSSLGMAACLHHSGLDSQVSEQLMQSYHNFLFLDSLASDNPTQLGLMEASNSPARKVAIDSTTLPARVKRVSFESSNQGSEHKKEVAYEDVGPSPAFEEICTVTIGNSAVTVTPKVANSMPESPPSQESMPSLKENMQLATIAQQMSCETSFNQQQDFLAHEQWLEKEVETNGVISSSSNAFLLQPNAAPEQHKVRNEGSQSRYDRRQQKQQVSGREQQHKANSLLEDRANKSAVLDGYKNGIWSQPVNPRQLSQQYGLMPENPSEPFDVERRMLSLATIRQDNLDPHDTAKDNRGLRRKQSYHYEQGSNSTTSDNGLCMSRSSGIGSRKSDRRVHFTPEKSSPLHEIERRLNSIDAAQQSHAWNDMGVSGGHFSFPALSYQGHGEQIQESVPSRISPSRFLQLAEYPSMNEFSRPPTFSQPAWDDQVTRQMEFASGLSSLHQQQGNSKLSNWKLQCIHHHPGSFGSQESDQYAAVPEQDGRKPLNLALPSDGSERQARRAQSKNLRAASASHRASHSTTTSLIKEVTERDASPRQRSLSSRRDQRISSFVAKRHAMLQAEAAKSNILTSSKTGPSLTSLDWDRSTMTSAQDQSTYSGPPSPSSGTTSITGHALSHVSYSPSSRRSGSIRLEDPWAPDMEAVKEGDESECDAIFEINSPDLPPSSYRPSMSPLHEHSASISLTEATLESRAVLDTVACDVDLAINTSIWPSTRATGSNRNFTQDFGRIAANRFLHTGNDSSSLQEASKTLQRERMLQSIPSNFWY